MYRILRAGTKIPTLNGRVVTLTKDAEVADEWRSDDHFAGSLFNWDAANVALHAADLQRFEVDELFEGKMHHVVYDRSYGENAIKTLTVLSRTELPDGPTPDEVKQQAEADKVKAEADAIALAKEADDLQARAYEAKAKAEDAQVAREEAVVAAEEAADGVAEPAPPVSGIPPVDPADLEARDRVMARARAIAVIGDRLPMETEDEYEVRVEAEITAQASRAGVLDGSPGEAS